MLTASQRTTTETSNYPKVDLYQSVFLCRCHSPTTSYILLLVLVLIRDHGWQHHSHGRRAVRSSLPGLMGADLTAASSASTCHNSTSTQSKCPRYNRHAVPRISAVALVPPLAHSGRFVALLLISRKASDLSALTEAVSQMVPLLASYMLLLL